MGGGNFANEAGVTGVSALTDGTFGSVDSKASYATCGNNAGNSVTYTLTNSVNGSDLTNIVIYSGWPDAGRRSVSITSLIPPCSAPTTFIPLTSVFYNPVVSGIPANRISHHDLDGRCRSAVNVSSVKFDFTPQVGGIDERLFWLCRKSFWKGTNSAAAAKSRRRAPLLMADTLPASVVDVVGGLITFSAAFSNLSSGHVSVAKTWRRHHERRFGSHEPDPHPHQRAGFGHWLLRLKP